MARCGDEDCQGLSRRWCLRVHQRLKQIDEGTLTLTNQRLVFDGSHENRNVQLSHVLSVRPWSDAIEGSLQRRAKSQVYRVTNPIIWCALLTTLAEGDFVWSGSPSSEQT